MPVIRGETRRGLRVLPGLRADQAMVVGVAAAVTWGEWHVHWASPLRLALMTLTAAAGAGVALLRWPFGPQGETLAVWLPRWLRYAARPRRLAGPRVPGWDGVQAIWPNGEVRTPAGTALVLECAGADGARAAVPAQRGWRELLHGVSAPFQVLVDCRWPDPQAGPASWRRAGPETPKMLASAYAAHWDELVAQRRVVVRRQYLVLTAPSGPETRARLDAAVGLATEALAAAGVVPRVLAGAEVVALLHQMGGAAGTLGPLDGAGVWSVRADA